MAQQVAITGIGLISAYGTDRERFWSCLHDGQSAIRRVRLRDTDRDWEQQLAPIGEIPLPDCVSHTERNLFRQLPLASLYCAEQALATGGLDPGSLDRARAGVIFGTGFGNLYDLESMYRAYFDKGHRAVSPLTIPMNMPNTSVARIGMKFGLHGVSKSVSTACSSALTAVTDGFRLIRDGYQDVILAGGVELTSCPTIVTCWERMRVLAPLSGDPTRSCRPFDAARNGLVLGEGGALFLLENLQHARRRGAPVFALVRGAYENADGFDLVKPSPQGEAECIRGALSEAGLTPAGVNMIQAHGTATRLNDESEYASLETVFGDRLGDIPLCAIKSMIGHTMGASGAFGLLAAIGSLVHGYFYPLPNHQAFDPGVRLNIAKHGERIEGCETVLINSFAFGGINSCLLVSRDIVQ